jgi:hypothetical protein
VPGGVTITLGGDELGGLPERVAGISINRGRQDELDRTGTGSCTISLRYRGGTIPDYTGAVGTVELDDPFGGSAVVFSGTVDEMQYELSPTQVITGLEVTLVDALDWFAGIEMAPGLNGIVPLPAVVDDGNIFYEQELVGPLGGELEGRIGRLVLESEYAGDWEIFSGNVQVKDTVYSPRTTILSAIQDAADAEFPGVANVFVQQDGTFTFHGRLARFNPTDPQYRIDFYKAGDGAATSVDPTRARINRCRLGVSRARLINAALATPEGIADSAIEGQVVTDAASIATYGVRSWSAENLLTWFDELNDLEANDAVKQFATYYVANYAQPQLRIEELTFVSRHPEWAASEETWDVLCYADISDVVTLKVTNPGIAIDDVDYFIEGVRTEITPLGPDFPMVRKSLDLSPRAYWATGF